SLLSSRVRNNTRMSQRRVVLNLSVDQRASAEMLQALPERIRTLVKSHKPVRFDRAHFATIGANSYDFEVVYFALTADFAKHMDILQSINLGLVHAAGAGAGLQLAAEDLPGFPSSEVSGAGAAGSPVSRHRISGLA